MKKIYVNQSKVSYRAKRYVDEVMNSNWIGLGKKVEEFEEKFADYYDAKYCIGTNSATSAIHLSLIISQLSGCDIYTTPITFVSVNNSILHINGRPIFCDINRKTGNVDKSSIEKVIENYSNSGIILTHYAGNLIDEVTMNYVLKMFGANKVINDYSHCAGAKYGSGYKLINSDFNIFSFHAVKNISTPDGGAIVTDNKEVYDLARKLRWCGIDKSTYERENNGYNWKYDVSELGYKYHMNDITAAFCLAGLEELDGNNAYRFYIMNKYIKYLNKSISMIPFTKNSSCHMAIVKLPEFIVRDEFLRKLAEIYEIYCGVHYYPNNRYSLFAFYDNNETTNADYFFDRIISLPCHLLMSEDDINYVINSVNELIEKESYKN